MPLVGYGASSNVELLYSNMLVVFLPSDVKPATEETPAAELRSQLAGWKTNNEPSLSIGGRSVGCLDFKGRSGSKPTRFSPFNMLIFSSSVRSFSA